jgi:hypothetical protein
MSRSGILHRDQLPGPNPETVEPDFATRIPGFEPNIWCLVSACFDHPEEVFWEGSLRPGLNFTNNNLCSCS